MPTTPPSIQPSIPPTLSTGSSTSSSTSTATAVTGGVSGTADVSGGAADLAPRPTARTRAVAETWEALFRAQVTLARRFLADDIWEELSMREYDVLFTLRRAPGGALRLRDLNEGILLSQPSLSRMVERLEQRGLVERCAAADDARGTVVRLTEEGRRLQTLIGRRHVRTIEEYVGGALDDDELDTLRTLLDKLRAAQAEIPDRGECASVRARRAARA